MQHREEGRERILHRLKEDLVGPFEENEVLSDLPSDRYLTGILFPQGSRVSDDENEKIGVDEDDKSDSTTDETTALGRQFRPSSAGLSFSVRSRGGVPHIDISITCARYVRDEEESTWQRTQLTATIDDFELARDVEPVDLGDHGIPGLQLHFRVAPHEDMLLVTAVLVNSYVTSEDESRIDAEMKTFFQTGLSVEAGTRTALCSRPSRINSGSEDADVSRLIYRKAREYASGHTCSATWETEDGEVTAVRTTWIPEVEVPMTSADGDEVFQRLREMDQLKPFSPRWLAEAEAAELVQALRLVPETYCAWLEDERQKLGDLPGELVQVAESNLQACHDCAARMHQSIDMINERDEVRRAFQLSNRAIILQHAWSSGKTCEDADFLWRPFQLAFQLLSLASLADGDHPDRQTMDLLWFPTGGGKTEAYLGLTAFLLFLRRLESQHRRDGAGVAVFMRYTLRLLTIQQFERASRLISACEYIRAVEDVDGDLGEDQFSIGLWIGGSTPKGVANIDDVEFKDEYGGDPRQLEKCPVCNMKTLEWFKQRSPAAVRVRCENPECPYGSRHADLPVWTVDEDIYREQPSLVIGTIDKFAQITRNSDTGVLFGIDTTHRPPDLIIQDELHLISGPLGTIAGLYEIAIDELCGRDGHRPKVIGSTATIRQAHEQVAALFDRDTAQFPPPCIDADNSCFAVVDKESPGRRYVGVTTAGRSAKFALQAASASSLQSAMDPDIPDNLRDYYTTLVAYFNSLRELGGALTLMQDDVNASINEYAGRRDEDRRKIDPPEELTSRVDSSDIPKKLKELETSFLEDGSIDVVLATNMISVGMDIDRLALMIVNGQPKSISEYIQSTSRVGRSYGPGLITVLFNNAKVRDRSHYETFSTWHQTLYREVEPTSVTPFAPRALDRAVHAVLVALVRHTIPERKGDPNLSRDDAEEARRLAEIIIERAREVDQREEGTVRKALEHFVDQWERRSGGLKHYWNDWSSDSLLKSAERAAAEGAIASFGGPFATPNSMRTVEPGTPYILAERLR